MLPNCVDKCGPHPTDMEALASHGRDTNHIRSICFNVKLTICRTNVRKIQERKKSRFYLLGNLIFFRRFSECFFDWANWNRVSKRPKANLSNVRATAQSYCFLYNSRGIMRYMFLLLFTFRFDERKRCSQASQYWHMRNSGFESRDVQNFSVLSPGSNADSDDSMSLLALRGYFYYYLLLIMFHTHLEPRWRTELMRIIVTR